jgi:hypothetical protein
VPDERLHALSNLITDGAHLINRLTFRIIKGPIVALRVARNRAPVAASHRDNDLCLLREFFREPCCWCMAQIDANLFHDRDHFRVDACTRLSSGGNRSRFRWIGTLIEQCGGHLGSAGVVNTREKDCHQN